MRITDTDNPRKFNWAGARDFVRQKARSITNYAVNSGILSHGAGFISIDKYGLDAMGHQKRANPHDSTWFFNGDHWNNYLMFVKTMHQTSGYPILLWQLPVGRINSTLTKSAYTGVLFKDLPNTTKHFEDSSPNYFLGDSFNPGAGPRLTHFSQNRANDPKITVSGNTVTWKDHMAEAKDAGVFSILFGAGVGDSTDGVGIPPTEEYWWIQKAQEYYKATPQTLGKKLYCSLKFVKKQKNSCTP